MTFFGIETFFREPCSLWFNRLWKWDWSDCCREHDREYAHLDFEYDRKFFRLMADEELRDCVNRILPGMGYVMFFGVRLFGNRYRSWVRHEKSRRKRCCE